MRSETESKQTLPEDTIDLESEIVDLIDRVLSVQSNPHKSNFHDVMKAVQLDPLIDLEGSDMSGTDLREVDLSEANLKNVILTNADLTEANLTKADLRGADLSQVNISHTNLSGIRIDENTKMNEEMLDKKVKSVLEIIRQGKKDLQGIDFSEVNLCEFDFSKANLTNANLQGANLRDANLRGAILRNANLSNADLRGADLRETDLWNVNFQRTIISQEDPKTVFGDEKWELVWKIVNQGFQDLSNKDLSGAYLVGVQLSGVNLSNTNLTEANLSGVNLSDATLKNANLSKANLTSVNLRGANLSKTNLTNADLENSDLTRAKLTEAELQGTNFKGSHLWQTNLKDSKITNATIIDEKWRLAWEIVSKGAEGRNLKNVDLSGTNLREANLLSADLSEANLSDALLFRAILKNANLSKSNLSNANLEEAGLREANLTEARLNNAVLKSIGLRQANLQDAHLNGANLDNANLQGANLDKADFRGAQNTESIKADPTTFFGDDNRWLLDRILLNRVLLPSNTLSKDVDDQCKKTLIISAIPDQKQTKLTSRYSAVVEYLEKELNISVIYEQVSDYKSAVTRFTVKDVDLVWFGGYTGFKAKQQVPQATAIAQRDIDQTFRSVFIAHKSTGISKLQDEVITELAQLREKKFSFTFGGLYSTSGHVMPLYYLQQAKVGLNDFTEHHFSGSHDDTIELVESGDYDIGVLNYKVWKSSKAAKQVDTDKVKEIWLSPVYYDYHWMIDPHSLVDRYDAQFPDKLQQALLKLNQETVIKELFGGEDFVTIHPENYERNYQRMGEIEIDFTQDDRETELSHVNQ